MGSDISRINFDAAKHYKSVRMQQGRVLTDDDYNEGNRIQEDDLRKSRVDIIGPYGSPDDGWLISSPRIDKGLINFDILAGVLYLGGLRLELEQLETYRLQKDWLQQPADLDKMPPFSDKPRYDLVFIEAWQQTVTAVEDDALFEVALGGPDTTTRLRNMRRVHLATDIGTCDCSDAWQQLIKNWAGEKLGAVQNYLRVPDEWLKVSYGDTGLPPDLCTPTAAGGYLGAENQAIRVQITDPGNFTWGFDNASPLYRVQISADQKTITLLTDPKDQYHWPLSGQVVELLPWSAVLSDGEKLAEMTGHLTTVDASYDPDSNVFTLLDAVPATLGVDWTKRDDFPDLDKPAPSDIVDRKPAEYWYLRVWNRGDDLSSPAKIPITAGPVALGHTGLEVTITGNDSVAGDFWVIAARPESPNLVVPWELEKGMRPMGPARWFAPLAVLRWTPDPNGKLSVGEFVHDCRKKFNPLTADDCCCTFSVGDGIKSFGDYNSIQQAVDALPSQGGKICVLAGEHVANVRISQKKQIRISGCGDQSIVRPGPKQITDPIFSIANAQKIRIDQLTLVALDGTAIEVLDDAKGTTASSTITIHENNILAFVNAIRIRVLEAANDNDITISYNRIGMVDRADGALGGVAIFSAADKVLIERNRIIVVPQPDPKDPDDPRPKDPSGGDPFDPCRDIQKTYANGFSIKFQVFLLLKYVILYMPSFRVRKNYNTLGGIQIGSGSERVRIWQNEITGGRGNGITLGDLPVPNAQGAQLYTFTFAKTIYTYSALYEIDIEGNTILQMSLNGISAVQQFDTAPHIVHIDDITIYRNEIRNCAQFIPAKIAAAAVPYVAFGGVVLHDTQHATIAENRIEENGQSYLDPICGVFILYGERTELSSNKIVNNGMFVEPTVLLTKTPIPRQGARGGIVVMMSFKAPDLKNVLAGNTPSFDGVPAVNVNDNIVHQPMGHALFLVAFGPVSVVSNQFTSQATDPVNPLATLGTMVMILDLGVSKDTLLLDFQLLANINPAAFLALLSNPAFQQLLRILEYLPSGKVMFSDNQGTLDMRSDTKTVCLSSILIASLDDIAFNSNQSECAGFISLLKGNTTLDIVLVNTVLAGASVRSNDNRFMDGLTLTLYSLFSLGFMNTAVGNQATRCLMAFGTLHSVHNNVVFINNPCAGQKAGLMAALGIPAGVDFN
ncbi:MAG TPA: DUF6519 domain-containing protein [Puia sp.]|nr:DUF6519 domain-containing protein [Puia sp.]